MKHPEQERIEREYAPEPLPLERRDFLKIAGGGIVIFFRAGDLVELAAQAQRGRGYPSDFNAYLRVAETGRVTIFSGKIEMGQGVITSLAQMAAEELGVSLQSIDMIMGDTDQCPYDMGTFGSMSTRFFGPAVRNAAAEARSVLLDLAAERLKVPKQVLIVENGVISTPGGDGNRVTFGQLAQGQRIERKMTDRPSLKPVSKFTISGKSPRRLDGDAKVTGKAHFAGDLRLPGMLYARVLRPPAHGAPLKSVDTSAAEKMPGVTVVNQEGLIATLAADPEVAGAALAAIKAEFGASPFTNDDVTIFDHIVEVSTQRQEREKKGDLSAGEKASSAVFEHTYLNGYGAHAAMETHTALAKVENGKATAWISTQGPFPSQQQIAQALGFPPENVRVITPFVGGGFGGKTSSPQAVEAARLSKIVGKPVQVMWTRAEEFFLDTFRPAAVVKVKSGVDTAGKISLWDYQVYAAGSRSAEQFYDVPNQLIRVYGQWGRDPGGRMHPFGTGPWRAPGANINVFARESQIDIMAAKAKVDPLEFRLNNTSDKRMRGVLEALAARVGWKKAAAPSGRGFGIACGIDAGSYVAGLAEVAVDKSTGKIKVKRIVCAQEMGVVINPEGAKMQMEGCLMMGLGYALAEVVRFKGGEVLDQNFDTYEVPRFSWMPELDAFLVKNDEVDPQGGGEPAIIHVGAMIANAVFDACGARVFQMPLTPERVKKAMA